MEALNRNGWKVILGSGSPRRRELLEGLGVSFSVDKGNSFVEKVAKGTPAEEVPMQMAMGKSLGFHRPLEKDEVLITADTVVITDSETVLGKPHCRSGAIEMLGMLSGRVHLVRTAVVIRWSGGMKSFTDDTEVEFSKLSPKETEWYVDNFSPMDKAGSYGVQEWIGYACIREIRGSFYNVMGLPTSKLYQALKEIGVL